MFTSDHYSVFLKESIELLNIKKGGRYIDCNLGGGGHTSEILKRGGQVAALDVDQNAIEHCSQKFDNEISNNQLKILKLNFKDIDKVPELAGWKNQKADGILYDLGLSTFQLKDEHKGFSFEDETSLDMRMDDSLGVKAEDLLRVMPVNNLADLFFNFGDEPQSKVFARAIKDYIVKKQSFTAKDIANVIKNASRYKHSRIHPATRVFQALRIAVNSELENLRESLSKSVSILEIGGRIVVISFHSLEDRIAKQLATSSELKVITGVPMVPTEEEVTENYSSRSAKMRTYEKL